MKRRSAPNRQSAGVSLFPFLAVLLCTMGALIVVLVVIARQARLQVAASADAAPDSELAARRADLEWRLAQLRQSREATKKTLADKQTELSHLEEHSRRLRQQLEELASARQRLSEIAAGDERDKTKLKSELDHLQQRVAGLRGELGKLMEKARQGQQSYAVIPYHGPNETYRRPIYIECGATGVVLQPSGLTLTEQDFAIDDGMGNPLASAVRAAREYYLRNSLKGEGETGNAYPLMIVRPDGVLAYLAARKVLESLGPDFGYELVSQDWQIEYPPVDPMLVLAMKQAVSEGRMRQAYLASAAPGLFYNRRQVSFRTAQGGAVGGGPTLSSGLHKYRSGNASGRPAGIAATSGAAGGSGGAAVNGQATSGNPYLDALAGDGSGAASGSVPGGKSSGQPGATKRGGDLRSRADVVRNDGIGGIGIGGTNAGEPLMAGGPAQAGQPATGARQSPTLGAQSSRSGFPGPGLPPASGPASAFANRGRAGGSANSKSSMASAGATVAAGGNPSAHETELTSVAGATTGRGSGNQRGMSTARVGSAPAATAGTMPATSARATAPSPSPGQASGSGAVPSAFATDDNATPASGAANGQPPASGSGRQMAEGGLVSGGSRTDRGSPITGSTLSGSGTSQGSVGRVASGAHDSIPTSDGHAPRGGASTRGGTSNSGTNAGVSSGGASNGGSTAMAGGSMGSSTMQPGQVGMPMPMIAMGAQPASDQNAPDRRRSTRERNWANPDASTSNVPVERRIQIICDAEHLTIMPEGRGARGMKVIKLGSHTEDSLDELVSTVWDRIDSWGTAGRGMYWRPKLVMVIEPGGQRRYTELQSLMADSGFDVHGRPRTVKQRR